MKVLCKKADPLKTFEAGKMYEARPRRDGLWHIGDATVSNGTKLCCFSEVTTLREFINALEDLSGNGQNDGLPVMVKKSDDRSRNVFDWQIEDICVTDGEDYVEGVVDDDAPTIKALTIE